MPIGSHWTQAETVDRSHTLAPEEIETQQFETVLRGYDPSAVVNFLRDVSKSYRSALETADSAERALAEHVCEGQTVTETVEVVREVVVEPSGDPYQAMSEEVATVLRAAYASAAEVRAKAEREAEETLADLERRASEQARAGEEQRASLEREVEERQRRSEQQAEELVAAAREEAERIRRDADAHRAQLRADEAEVEKRLAAAADLLNVVIGRLRTSEDDSQKRS